MAERPVEQPGGNRRTDDERDDLEADRVADAFEEERFWSCIVFSHFSCLM